MKKVQSHVLRVQNEPQTFPGRALTAQMIDGDPYLWTEIDDALPNQTCTLVTHATGSPIASSNKWLASFLDDEYFVHVYEVRSPGTALVETLMGNGIL